MLTPSDIMRFNAKIDKSHGACGCWLWRAAVRSDGYGQISIDSRMVGAHRIAYMIAHGPATAHVLHTCDTPLCVNPFHLVCGTNADNMRHKMQRGRASRTGGAKGRKHYNATLTEDQVRAIRQDPRPQKQIAKQYGLAQSTVSLIKTRRRWASL